MKGVESVEKCLIELSLLTHVSGYCWSASIDVSDTKLLDSSNTSVLLIEDGKPIGQKVDTIDDVIATGNGCHYFENGSFYFSAGDSSSPDTNNRSYALIIRANLRCSPDEHPINVLWTPELVDSFWSKVAFSSMAKFNFSRLNGNRLAKFIAKNLENATSIIDFGAGNGEFVLLLMDRGYKCGVYEVSQGRSQIFRQPEFKNNPLFLGQIDNSASVQFDIVLLLDVIEHLLDKDIDEVLSLVHRFVSPGGQLIISTPNNEVLEDSQCICPVCNHTFHRWQHVQSFTGETLTNLLEKKGFSLANLHKVDFSDNVTPEDIEKSLGTDEIRLGAESHLLYIGIKK